MTRARSGSEALGCFSLPRCRSQQAVRRCDAHVGAPQALIGQNSDTPWQPVEGQHWQRPSLEGWRGGSRCRPCGGSPRRAGGQGQPLTSSTGSGPVSKARAVAAGAGLAGVAFAGPEVRGSP